MSDAIPGRHRPAVVAAEGFPVLVERDRDEEAQAQRRRARKPTSWLLTVFMLICVGYFLLPPARGAGIATEAVRLLVHYAFDHMAVNRVWATCDADNAGSANVLRRAGIPEEGRMRAETRDHHRRLRDTLMFGLSLGDFAAWIPRHGVVNLRYL